MARGGKISKRQKQEIKSVFNKYKEQAKQSAPHKRKFIWDSGLGVLWGTCLTMDLMGGAGMFLTSMHALLVGMNGLTAYGAYKEHKNRTWRNTAKQTVVSNENVETILTFMELQYSNAACERAYGNEEEKQIAAKKLKEIYNDAAKLAPLYDIKSSNDNIYQFYDPYKQKTAKQDIAHQQRRKKPKSFGK